MSDHTKPKDRTQPTDEERRNAAAKTSAQNSAGNRGTQVQASAPDQPAKPQESTGDAKPKESFEHAGRAVRAQPSPNKDWANQHTTDTDERSDPSSSDADERDLKSDEEAEPNDSSAPIDERTARKARTQQTADEEKG